MARELPWAAALAALLAGCSLEPRYEPPALPVPAQWRAPAGPAAGAIAASETGWREFFPDPHLQALIAQALAGNRDLRVAVLSVERVRAQYRVRQADRLPAVDASASATRQRQPPALAGSDAAQVGSLLQAGLGVTAFELDLFGRVRSLEHAAQEQLLAQEESRRAVHLGLVAEVANAWLALAADRRTLQLARDTFRSQSDSFELTRSSHGAGGASGLDLAQAGTTVEAARADVARYEGSVAQDVDALELLAGGPVDPALLEPAADALAAGLPGLPPALSSSVLLRRPDVLAAEHALRAANADIGAARAACFPSLSLTVAGGSASEQLSGLFAAGSGFWTIAPQAVLPIFDGGRARAGVEASKAARDIALAQYERTIQSAFREVADGLALAGTLARQREAAQALVEVTGRAYALSQDRHRAGRDSYLVVLDSQRSHYAAQQRLIAVTLAEQGNRVGLYKALGGGWLERGTGS
jgi:multidrug efflux system outer membrane protein